MAYTPKNPNGQATKANSAPVVLPSDQVGTAGTPAADVLSVQGITSGTPIDVSLASETTKVIGTVRLTDGAGNLLTTNSSVIAAKFALDVNLLSILGTALTSTVAGKIDVSASGFAASGATKVGNPVLIGGAFNTTQPTVTNGQAVDAQMTARGAQIVASGVEPIYGPAQPATTGGWSTDHWVSTATTNARNIKASAGQVGGWYIYNSASTAIKVVLHNTAGTPTAGASVFLAIVVPPLSGANVEFTQGIAFSTGIGMTIVTGLADNNASAVAANDIVSNIFYK